MSGGVGGRGGDELPSSTQPRRRPSTSMLTNQSPPRLRTMPDQRWSPEPRRISYPQEGASSGRSSAPRVHSVSPDIRREPLLPPAAISPPPHRRSSREPPRSTSSSVPSYYDERYLGRARDYPEPAIPDRLERSGEASSGPPGAPAATPNPQPVGNSARARSPRRASTFPGLEQSYGPSSSQHGARERQVSGYGASSAAVPMPGSEISGGRGRYDRGPRASFPQERPRAFFTPLATAHRDLSTWPRDLVDTYRLGWEDAMAAVAEGQFHIDDVVHHRVPLWPPPGRPTSQPRPPTAHDPELEREAKRDLERRSRDRELETLPYPANKEPRLSPARSMVAHPSAYPSAPPPYPPYAHPHSHSGAQVGSGPGPIPDYAPPYPPATAPYPYPYTGGHYPPSGPYDHPSYGPHVMPGGMYGGPGAGAYSRASEQPTPHLRNRQMISCHPCRSRKVKCSGGHPCEACIKIKKTSECEYEKTVRRRGKGKKSLMGESEWQSESQRREGGRGDGGSEEEGGEGERRPSGATTSQATSVTSKPSRQSSERNERHEVAEAPHDDDNEGSPERSNQPRGTKRSRSDSRSKPPTSSRRGPSQSRRP
ncbi:hypothetical protein A1Q2_04346 [Trichosporon asahii var. asahii CBS 8904]|uniref:Zn(2)-C6 fungal-type domain-containing protein n=1 Tax=Trichosporon asahii var. asahii (strain CBS 8904) TaxID=1220162 RepID=K1VWZ2_TRIAC|nr:hypothetical protein A1Q2_04346 [Trichosporon asahii var. asahii CBS 8904]